MIFEVRLQFSSNLGLRLQTLHKNFMVNPFSPWSRRWPRYTYFKSHLHHFPVVLRTGNYEIRIQHLILIKNSLFWRRLGHCWRANARGQCLYYYYCYYALLFYCWELPDFQLFLTGLKAIGFKLCSKSERVYFPSQSRRLIKNFFVVYIIHETTLCRPVWAWGIWSKFCFGYFFNEYPYVFPYRCL